MTGHRLPSHRRPGRPAGIDRSFERGETLASAGLRLVLSSRPKNAPDVQPRENGPITFGCFNAFSKINPRLVAIWAELLKRVPGSRLLLKSAGAGEASARQRLTGQFAEHGIPAERIEMLGRIADPRRHLELYQRVDRGVGHVSLSRYDDHLRSPVDGCPRGESGRPDARFAGGGEPAEQRRPAGIDRAIRRGICVDRRRTGERFAAIGRTAPHACVRGCGHLR